MKTARGMGDLKLYRGICVAKSEGARVRREIESAGLKPGAGHWRMRFPPALAELRRERRRLLQSPELNSHTVLDQSSPTCGICACGEEVGAAFYAWKHNSHPGRPEEQIAVEFTAPIEDVIVDGRDLLYTVFQFWDWSAAGGTMSAATKETQLRLVKKVFGTKVQDYFLAARNTLDQERRIGFAALATIDPAVIRAHWKNRTPLRGRSGTTFCSAFIVRGPVPSDRITRVYRPTRWSAPQSGVLDLNEDFILARGVGQRDGASEKST